LGGSREFSSRQNRCLLTCRKKIAESLDAALCPAGRAGSATRSINVKRSSGAADRACPLGRLRRRTDTALASEFQCSIRLSNFPDSYATRPRAAKTLSPCEAVPQVSEATVVSRQLKNNASRLGPLPVARED
jgi:hypothetical protein